MRRIRCGPKPSGRWPAILKAGIWAGLILFFGFQQFGRDGEGREGFEEDGPGGKDRVGSDRGQMSEEAGSLGRCLARGYPGRFEQFEHRVPGEGEEVQARQHHRQKSLAMAEIVLELVAVIFHHVEAFVLDLPARPAAGDDFGDILFRDGQAGDPCHGVFGAALCIDDFEADPVDEHGVLAVAQRYGLEPAVAERVGGLALADFFVVTKGLGALDEVVQRLEADLEFLMRAALKIETIREDLGKVGPVIAAQVEEAMLGRRSRLDTTRAEHEAEPARRMLKFERKLREQMERLATQLHDTQRELNLTPEHIENVVRVGLDLADQPVRAEYPDRPITLIVPFAAGGANNSVARLLANKLGPILGQTVVVENRPGGGTVIGSAAVARSKSGGYTILLVSAAHTINPYILRNIPYDTLQDFTPISQLTRTAYILVTSQASKFDKIEDLVTAGVAPNRQITFASSGTGSAPHLAGQLFATLAGANAMHIPYQGGAPAVIGVLRGDVDLYFSSIAGARPFLESKQMRALGVSSDKRLAMLPDIPTIAEQGVQGFAIDGCYGVVGPANLPTDVTASLNAGIVKALADPDLVSRLRPEGEEVVGSSPEAFDALLHRELAKYETIVAAAGLGLIDLWCSETKTRELGRKSRDVHCRAHILSRLRLAAGGTYLGSPAIT